MHNKSISFSSDDGKFSREDLNETSRIAEDYFGMQNDVSQIPATKETKDWIYRNAKDYLNIVRSDENIVGYAFMLPCNKKLMNDFLNKKINEAELFEGIKKIKLVKIPETIYLCASFLKEDFRGRGLATKAFIKSINKITKNGEYKPILFYWGIQTKAEDYPEE